MMMCIRYNRQKSPDLDPVEVVSVEMRRAYIRSETKQVDSKTAVNQVLASIDWCGGHDRESLFLSASAGGID